MKQARTMLLAALLAVTMPDAPALAIEVVVNFRPAVELGKAHGLTHFEDEVRAELARYAEEPPQP